MNTYLIVKSLHVAFVMFWMAGLFYLPRLYAYHVTAKFGGELDLTLRRMEDRLLKIIMNPAMILSLILGLWLAHFNGLENLHGWFHLKMLLIVLLMAFHMWLAACRKRFINGTITQSERFFRVINELPPVLAIVIIFLAIGKPF